MDKILYLSAKCLGNGLVECLARLKIRLRSSMIGRSPEGSCWRVGLPSLLTCYTHDVGGLDRGHVG